MTFYCCCEGIVTGGGKLFRYGFMWLQSYVWILLSVCCMSRADMPHVLFGT